MMTQKELAEVVAKTWNTLDVKHIEPYLSDDYIYDSFWVLETMKGKENYIDYLKALGICLVVCYHSRYIPFDNTVFAGLFSCCVPIFFMVNGYMMLRKERTISDLWKSNLKLIGLTIIWSFILSAFAFYEY